MPALTTIELIKHDGVHVREKACSCCDALNLFRVELDDPRAPALLICSLCDLDADSRFRT